MEENIASDNSIMHQKKDSVSAMQSEEALPQVESTGPRRNQLAFDYFKELVREGEDRRAKLGLLWTVFDMLNCTLWKVELLSKEGAELTPEVLQTTYTEATEKIKHNLIEDEFGWFGLYGEPIKELRGVFCLTSR